VTLGFEFRASYLLGRHTTSSVVPPALFALAIFQIGSHIYAQASLGCNPPVYSSQVAGMTGVYHHIHHSMVEMRSY
jgi:hypothetical protein